MILFLSFEGVLHTTGNRQPVFTKLDLLEQWLRQHPNVDIVISSKWRHHMGMTELQQLFSQDIQARIVGVTPAMRHHANDAYWRLTEIFDWLQHCGSEHEWLVLDDGVFPERFNRLVKCNPLLGLTEQNLDSLTHLKRRLLMPPPNQGFTPQEHYAAA